MASLLNVFRWLAVVACLALDLVRAGCNIDRPVEISREYTTESIHFTFPLMFGKVTTRDTGALPAFDNHFYAGQNVGSYMDAPSHFNAMGWSIDEIPLERFSATGAFLDVSADVAAKDPKGDFRLTKDYIDKWVQRNGDFPANTVLLIKFGWGQYFDDPLEYWGTEGSDMENAMWPGLDPETASHLAGLGQVVGVGVDLPSMDPPNKGDAHVALAAGNLYSLESLDLDDTCLPEKGFHVHAMPINIQNGTTSPVRVFAAASSSDLNIMKP